VTLVHRHATLGDTIKYRVRPDIENRIKEGSVAARFEINVPNLFIAGGAIAGRQTGTIFIENGRFHGEKIVAVLAERFRPTE
jgi:hypothetical protein